MTILDAALLGLLKIDLMVLCQLVAMKIHGQVGPPLLDTAASCLPVFIISPSAFLSPLSLPPFHISHIVPLPVSPWVILSRFPSLFKTFFICFFWHTHTPLSFWQPRKIVLG